MNDKLKICTECQHFIKEKKFVICVGVICQSKH